MATNTKYQKIIKRIHKGNLGLELQMMRQMREVDEVKASGIELNQSQLSRIAEIELNYNKMVSDIKMELNEKYITDLEDEEEE